jgi:pilus assembly protein Flp/PilA
MPKAEFCPSELLTLQPLNGVVATTGLLTMYSKQQRLRRRIWISRRIREAARINQGWVMRKLTALLHCEKGANAIEFALVATLIAIAAYAAFIGLGNKLEVMFNNVSNQMPSN